MTKHKTHGGARPGAGRPKKELTTTLSYRVPLKQSPKIDEAIRLLLDGLVNGKGATVISDLGGITATRKF